MNGIVIARTGVGKTEISIEIAKKIGAEIISADSMQIYKYLNVGTAKIKPSEMQGIKHYQLDIVQPTHNYSVGDYYNDVNKILSGKEKENKPMLLVGGTGLYINAITNGLSNLPPESKKIREELGCFTSDELYKRLEKVDSESAVSIHPNNRRRVERALEENSTGEKFSVLSKKNVKGNNYKFFKAGLIRDREHLYERINIRVDMMFEEGLVDEAREVYERFQEEIIKIQAIGYKELFDYFRGFITLTEAKDLIKRNSRRYAKRQLTWFNNDKDITWYDVEKLSKEEIIKKILLEVKKWE